MKKVLILALLFTALSTSIKAQVDTTKLVTGWNTGLVGSLTFTQVAYSDWATGGDDALAYNASIIGKSVNEQEMTGWTNNYKFAFGQANLANKGLRKTDDVIDLESIIYYKLNTYVNPYAGATFKTQFATGYQYSDTDKVTVSSFLDPLYARQAVGVGFIPIPEIKTRVGLALRETFTSIYSRWADDPATEEIETTRIQGGMEWITEASIKFDDDLLFTSKLETFAPFDAFDKWVIYNDNVLSAKITKLISVLLNVTIKYEEFVAPRTQIREGLAIGISYQLL